MLKPPKVKLVFDRKKKVKGPEDRGLVEYYIYLPSRKTTYYSTGFHVTASEWDSKEKKLSSKAEGYIEINILLVEQINAIQNYAITLMKEGKELTKNRLNAFMTESTAETFNDYAWAALKRSGVASSTYASQRRSLEVFDELAGTLNFSELTLEVLEDITYKMFHKLKYQEGTVWRIHKDVKKYVNRAMKHGYIAYHQNPYTHFINKVPAAKHEFLTHAELKALEQVDPPEGEFKQTLDAFLFSCYTGLRFSDLKLLDGTKVQQKEDGSITLTLKRMVKVDKRVFQKLSELFNGKPQEIIRPYLEKFGDKKYIWGKQLHNSDCNKLLKIIAEEAGISKHLTMHIGRHTFGTLYAHETGSIFQVMKMMGIAKYETAQVYINLAEEI